MYFLNSYTKILNKLYFIIEESKTSYRKYIKLKFVDQ